MKTITELPTIPADWRWVRGPDNHWDPVSPALAAELIQTAEMLGGYPTFGTPPAGSTVWDQRTRDFVLYQPGPA